MSGSEWWWLVTKFVLLHKEIEDKLSLILFQKDHPYYMAAVNELRGLEFKSGLVNHSYDSVQINYCIAHSVTI